MLARKTDKANKGKRQAALADLRERIVDGEYPQGAKLVEQYLAREFGISRPMLRGILVDLESQGLVEKRPNKGTVVRWVDAKSLLEIMDMREVLEGLAARLAAEKTSADDWQDLEKELAEPFSQMVENLEYDRYLGLITRFRERMVRAAQNEELSRQIHSLYAKIMIVQRRIVILPGRIQEAVEEHRQVLKAIMEGDAERAEAMKRLNIRNARIWLEKYKKWVV